MRIILYTGKGGVGKTSVAAATALRCAEQGCRTLVFSTDTAHSLGDSFDLPLGPEPRPVAENLWAQEVDVHYSIKKHWGTFQKYMVGLLSQEGIDELVAEEVAIIPGLDEGASLLWLNQYADEERYDVVIIDAAPTAETLRLLSLPDVSRWWFERLLPMVATGRLLAPVARSIVGEVPVPDDEALEALEHLFAQLKRVHTLLTDPSQATVRLVINAEKMVIKEAQRTYTYLNLYGYATDAVICNRLIPDEVSDPYFAAWKTIQAAHFALIEECFAPLPVLTAPLFQQEIVGLEMLRLLADALFGDEDPSRIFFEGWAHRIVPIEGGYELQIRLPFTEKGAIQLLRDEDELTITVGNQRRNFILPRALWDLDTGSARFEEGVLRVTFLQPA